MSLFEQPLNQNSSNIFGLESTNWHFHRFLRVIILKADHIIIKKETTAGIARTLYLETRCVCDVLSEISNPTKMATLATKTIRTILRKAALCFCIIVYCLLCILNKDMIHLLSPSASIPQAWMPYTLNPRIENSSPRVLWSTGDTEMPSV